MKFWINNKTIDLTQKHFLAEGGEGKIYVKQNTAFKICSDINQMIPLGKIAELSTLKDTRIINPLDVIYTKNKQPIGYTMKYIKDTYSLCQLFTKSFKQRNNIENDRILELVKKFRNMIAYIHTNNILVVDLNELNFLVSEKFDELYAIDVNSYQTRKYPATAIMDSIRDRHAQKFTQETDWFSWGILTFQMIIGMHPYKGKHPKYKGLSLDERIEKRMIDNVSVFNKDAKMPAAAYPIGIIPPALKQWYEAVFENGVRCLPPDDFEVAVLVIQPKIESIDSNLFAIEELQDFNNEIISIFCKDFKRVTITKNEIFTNKVKHDLPTKEKIWVGFSNNHSIATYIEKDQVKLKDLEQNQEIPINLSAKSIMTYDGRIYVQNGINIIELQFTEMPNKIISTSKIVGKMLDLPNATQFFDGGVLQNLLGKWFVSLFPISGQCHQFPIPELNEHRIIEAKYDTQVLVVIGVKNGKYDRFVFRFDNNFNYDIRKIENISYNGINFTVSDNGVVILINEEDKIEIFSNKINSSVIKELEDSTINGNTKLFHDTTKVMFAKSNKLFKFSTK